MSRGGEDLLLLFNEVIGGLTGPISGMGTAFSASLFGLAGSLVLGFLDLQATQAQNAFYNELEEWLAGLTRLARPRARRGWRAWAAPPCPPTSRPCSSRRPTTSTGCSSS
jgi:hypothetical protein